MSGPYDLEEQERLAELKGWWEDNGKFVVAAVVAAILSVAGWKGWQSWSASRAEEAGAMFQAVEKAARERDAKKTAEAAQPLIDRHPGSFYASDAALLLAKNAFEAGNHAEARAQLEWVVKNGVEELRGVARLRLAAVLLDEKKYGEALQVLDASQDPAYVALVADLKGDIMLVQGRLDEARAAYKLAIEKAEPRNPVRNIAEVKLNALGGAQ